MYSHLEKYTLTSSENPNSDIDHFPRNKSAIGLYPFDVANKIDFPSKASRDEFWEIGKDPCGNYTVHNEACHTSRELKIVSALRFLQIPELPFLDIMGPLDAQYPSSVV